jgi:hypothetical protein
MSNKESNDIVQNKPQSGMIPVEDPQSPMLSSRSIFTGGIDIDSDDNDEREDKFVVNTN